jgi:transposase
MIVIGADPHKKTHTLVAVDAASGEQRSCETVATSTVGSERALRWARRLGA